MKVKKVIRIVALLVLSIGGCFSSRPALGVERLDNVRFAEVDGQELFLDLYLPESSGPELVVYIHGGGWKGGSKSSCLVDWLVNYGYAVASIDYRLTDQAIFPAQIHDCKGAIRWLRANAKQYGYSVDRIAVTGTSAGGHLSALLGTSADVKELEGDVGGNLDFSSRVDAVVDFYGPTDFILRSKTQPHRANEKGSVVYRLLGGGADQKTQLAKLASPVTHVGSGDPPFLVLHGDQDKTVLMDQSERLAEVYQRAGLPLDLVVLPGSGHGGKTFFTGEARKRVVQFLELRIRR